MKNLLILWLISSMFYSCESKKDSCIRRLVDEQGYSYKDACENCDEMRNNFEGDRE